MRAVDADRRPRADQPRPSFEGLDQVIRAWAADPPPREADNDRAGADAEPTNEGNA